MVVYILVIWVWASIIAAPLLGKFCAMSREPRDDNRSTITPDNE